MFILVNSLTIIIKLILAQYHIIVPKQISAIDFILTKIYIASSTPPIFLINTHPHHTPLILQKCLNLINLTSKYQISPNSSNQNSDTFYQIPTLATIIKYFQTMLELPEEISAKLAEIITKEVTKEYIKQQSNPNQINSLVPASKVEAIKIIKTPSMTYSEYLNKVLRQPAAIKAVGPGGRNTYRLVEDLHIITALSKQPNVTNKLFDDISRQGRINRSAESIRNRYNEIICHLTEDDMKKITEYLEKQGVEGYLIFQNNEIRISLKDPSSGNVGKRVRQETLDNQQKGADKKVKRSVPPVLTELNDALAVYSRTVNIPISQLLAYLDKTSGDLIALDRYIETKDERLLWTDQEDQLIKGGGSELEALKRYRTEKDIHSRKSYLGI